MAPRKTVKARTKAAAATAARRKMAPPSLLPVRTIAVTVGLVGLAALAVALAGPRRVRDDYLRPISNATLAPLTAAVTPQAERAWAEIRPWRDHLGRILASINTEEVRELIADRLSGWLERFR